MEEMAVINQVNPWRLPLSPTLRDNDYFEQEQSDLFQNLEKLIASAVSICRLNGSLQCQIGGLITVIEELQRLLRHSFSEIKRLEKTIDHQKHNSASKIANLHKQVMVLETRVGTSNWTTIPILQEDHCMTPGSSSNSEKCIFNGEKDASQASEEGHVSLVDESYGNEESDNNLEEQAEETENSEAIVNSESANEEASPKDETDESQSPVESAAGTTEMEEHSQESVDTNSSDQTVEFSSIEIPRILRNSKQTIDSKSSSEGLSSEPIECRSESVARSRRMNSKSTLSKGNHQLTKDSPPVKKQGRKPKQPRQDDDFVVEEQKLNRVESDEGKESRKIKATRAENCIQKGFKRKLRVQPKATGIKPKPEKDDTLKEVERASKSNPLQENPMDRYINLDFLLTVNQIMSDLVSNDTQEEAALDQVNENARKDVVNLAKLYRLRVRIVGKCEEEFPVVLVKGRESCFPKAGEVDSLLSKMSILASKQQAGLLKRSETSNSTRNQNVGSKSKKKKV